MRSLPNARSLERWIAPSCIAALTAIALRPFLFRSEVPLFSHDWIWSPFADRDVWTAQFLYSSWKQIGLGEPNSAPSVNPLAWAKVVFPLLLSGRASLLLYLFLSFAFALGGVYRICRVNLGMKREWSLIGAALFGVSPFTFNKVASGQSSYWAGAAAFAWGLSFCLEALERDSPGALFRSALAFALATVQMQFLAFAWLAYGLGALTLGGRRRLAFAFSGAVASASLALPALWFLAMRGPERGAGISPAYLLWMKSQSSSPSDAVATLGYAARYVERSLGNGESALQVVWYGAIALILFGIAGALTDRRRPVVFLAAMGLTGYVWITGIDGHAAALWQYALVQLEPAAFFRELYHAAVLYALPLCVVSALGFERAARFAPWPARIAAVTCAGTFGLATWTGGLGRILPFTSVPSTHEALVEHLPKRAGRVLFLPAQEPLALQGNDVGGSDGLDWSDSQHLSLYEYYLAPPLVYVEAALRAGDDAPARNLLPRMGCVAVVYRPTVHSLAYDRRGAPDRTRASLRRAFGSPLYADRDEVVFAVQALAPLSAASRIEPLPAGLNRVEHDAAKAYADVAGDDPADAAPLPRPPRPQPEFGWIGRRDAPAEFAESIAAPAYGIVTTRPGAATTLHVANSGDALVWAPAGLDIGQRTVRGSSQMQRIAVEPGALRLMARGPAAIAEIGERTNGASRRGAIRIDAYEHAAPWDYRARVSVDERGALVLRERYDDGWLIEANGLKVERHERADGFGNLWILAGNGTHDVRIYYDWQRPTELLLALSLLALLFLTALARRP